MRLPPRRHSFLSDAPLLPLDMEAEAHLDRCGALKDFWYVACRSADLRPHRPLARMLFGVRLVLFRDVYGQAAALRDRCLHRQARLSAGRVLNGCLACPYHGWVYDRTGRCVEIPSLGPGQRGQALPEVAAAPSVLKLTPAEVGQVERFAALEQDGLVYVYMGGDPQRARRPAFRIPHREDPAWTTYDMVTHFHNGVTHLVENFMDVPHTVFVHHGWFRRRSPTQLTATVQRSAGSVCVTYTPAQDTLTGLGRLLQPAGTVMLHTDRFYVPNVTCVDYAFGSRSGFNITSQCIPITALESVVYTAISYRLPVDVPQNLLARLCRPFIKWYTRRVIGQDVEIMRVQRDGLANGAGSGRFMHTAADLPHTDIEAYRAWLLAGAPGHGPGEAERDIALWL